MIEFHVSVISLKSILVLAELNFSFGLSHRNKVLTEEFQATTYKGLGGQGKPLLRFLKSHFVEVGSPLPMQKGGDNHWAATGIKDESRRQEYLLNYNSSPTCMSWNRDMR